MAIHELRAKRATAFDAFKAIAGKADFDAAKDQPEYDKLKAAVAALDGEIARAKEVEEIERKTALPVAGQEGHHTYAAAKDDPYTDKAVAEARGLGTNKGLIAIAMAKAFYLGGSSRYNAVASAKDLYGERHPVTEALGRGFAVGTAKALAAGVGASGGFIVPPDYVNEIIELLRPRAVVRAANPRSMPMPRGTMTLPAQTAASVASYGRRNLADHRQPADARRHRRHLQEADRAGAGHQRPDALRRPRRRRLRARRPGQGLRAARGSLVPARRRHPGPAGGLPQLRQPVGARQRRHRRQVYRRRARPRSRPRSAGPPPAIPPPRSTARNTATSSPRPRAPRSP